MKDQKGPRIIPAGTTRCDDRQYMEFHIKAEIRANCAFDETLFASSGNVIFANFAAVQRFVESYNRTIEGTGHDEWYLKAGQVNAMGLIDEIFHFVCRLYRRSVSDTFFTGMADAIERKIGRDGFERLLAEFTAEFPPVAVYRKEISARDWLEGGDQDGIPNRILALEELMLIKLANENPAFEPFQRLFGDKRLAKNPDWAKAWNAIRSWSVKKPTFGPEGYDLVSMLKAPVEYSPYDLKGQLDYIRTHWQSLLGEWLARLLSGRDLIAEEEKAQWAGGVGGGNPPMEAYEFGDISKEYERFSPDQEWMPTVVLMAKSALVWLSQLSQKYGRSISRLDEIPDEELDFLADAGFTGLWLIGIWERSPASARIKQICGNPEAAASAYSLDDYDIARELGGWDALNNLRTRAWKRGLRLASDMVPNHTGMDAKWVVEKPDLFMQTRECPFPGYDFNGENLSRDGRVSVYLDNHYYSKTDCAVVFKRVDNASGDTRYIYHGNDGTGMPWNDTAQIDFLNPAAREEVIQKILHVARNFPIIRFDAAMVLAKKHIQRLWYPEPGKGGDIASRSRFAIGRDEFERRIPEEFWREVVDRCAKEIPDTLLLAEAFWMMEGYFVRTLGMHRVYNSAFMNMLKREDNEKYRTTIKNTIEFDPEILKRYVNFMNNPDEETAVAQFGKGDKYFGVCTMMVAMPGLPMFGHGQIEGFEEKYGMEYRRAYRDEKSDDWLVERHRREIFPLMKKRWLFSGVDRFRLYDFYENGNVNENVFAWSNRVGSEKALIFFNNKYDRAVGWIKDSAAFLEKRADGSKALTRASVAEGLGIMPRDGRYCVMQEQRSGLWYLRTTREIAEQGLYAQLDGFQTQVFVGIHEVDDDERGQYRALYESLGGNGVEDVAMAIKNIFLKDLYRDLADLASPDFFRTIREIRDGKDRAGVKEFLAEITPKAKRFYATAKRFIDGEQKPAKVPAPANKKKETIAENDGVELAVARLVTGIRRLLELPDCANVAAVALSPESRKLAERAEAGLRAEGRADEAIASALVIFSIRSIVGPAHDGPALRKRVEDWSLDRKMAELLTRVGMDARKARDAMAAYCELFVIAGAGEIPSKKREGLIVAALMENDGSKLRLGVHTWDNARWFNKEAAETMLERSIALSAFGCSAKGTSKGKTPKAEGDGWDELLADLAAMRKNLMKAIADSGYRVDRLLERYEPAQRKESKVPVIKEDGAEKKETREKSAMANEKPPARRAKKRD